MSTPAALVWLRNDLRLADNPALDAAVKHGGSVIPVFIWAPDEEAPWAPGGASRWWQHQSLRAFERGLQQSGSRLVIRRGPTLETLRALARETGANAVFWNRRYEPAILKRDANIKRVLRDEGLAVETFNAALLHEPGTIENSSGKPFRVFSAFWRQCLKERSAFEPLPRPKALRAPIRWPQSLVADWLELEPKIDWASGLRGRWQPGETAAMAALDHFLAEAFSEYAEQRNRPDVAGTSRLSPHLHFGEISPRQIWRALTDRMSGHGSTEEAFNSQFCTELGWREFAHHLLYSFPHTPEAPLRPEFEAFPWHADDEALRAWQQGRTGYPIVDAGMRELWSTGWMHNRVRMIVASFLVKDLLLPWQEGARWFWDTLVDADLAQNTLGWQWTAGSGADAAPYFRVFNPVSQGQKFDPEGAYVRGWCPELTRVPTKWIHEPHRAPAEILEGAGVRLGKTYPEPVINHSTAREVALEAFGRLKSLAVK